MQHRPDDSEKLEDLQYQLNGSVGKKQRAQKAVEPLQSQLDSARATVDIYGRDLANFTKRVRTDVSDGIDGILFEFLQEAQKLIKSRGIPLDGLSSATLSL